MDYLSNTQGLFVDILLPRRTLEVGAICAPFVFLWRIQLMVSPRFSYLTLMILLLGAIVSPAMSQMRVTSYNVARLWGDLSALEEVIVAFGDDDLPGFAVAPAIMAFQEVRSSNVPVIEGIVSSALPGVSYTTATFTSSPSEDGAGGGQLMLFRSDLFTEQPFWHEDIFTQGGRDTDRWKLQIIGSQDEGGILWVYSSHLKASPGSSNEEERFEGASDIRTNAEGLGSGANIIFVGDYNFYSNSEDAYIKMTESGINQGIDPLGNGSWSGSQNALKHTQSPRLSNKGSLVGGGIDDRFDFHLYTSPMISTGGFSLIPDSYRCLGNDGNHYNESINDGNNSYYPGQTSRSNALADALFEASDHMPVVSDFALPGRLTCILSGDLGRVVSGGSQSIPVLIANGRTVVDESAASALNYTYSGDSVLLGSGSGTAPLLPSFDSKMFSLVAGLEGKFFAQVDVDATSTGVSYPSYQLTTQGTAVRVSNPSFSSVDDLDQTTYVGAVEGNSGSLVIEIPIYNFNWDSLQAGLDLENASGLSGRFFPVDGFNANITDEPSIVRFGFNSNGAADGVYTSSAVISTSDEDIPGETSRTISLSFEVTVGPMGSPADFNGDGFINGADLGLLLAAWGPCPPPCIFDLTGDGFIDGADLGLVLADWG